MSNQLRVIQSRPQVLIAAQVFSSSCVYVPAVTVPIENLRVLRIHQVIQAPIADLPVPCPLDSHMRIGRTGLRPSKPRLTTSLPSDCKNSFCTSSGPVSFSS